MADLDKYVMAWTLRYCIRFVFPTGIDNGILYIVLCFWEPRELGLVDSQRPNAGKPIFCSSPHRCRMQGQNRLRSSWSTSIKCQGSQMEQLWGMPAIADFEQQHLQCDIDMHHKFMNDESYIAY